MSWSRGVPSPIVSTALLLALVALAAAGAGCSGDSGATPVEGVPEWLPVFPDSEVSPMFETPTETGSQGAVSFRVPATASEVTAFYRDELQEAGFEVEIIPYRSQVGRGARIEGGDSKTGFHAIVAEETGGTASVIFNYVQTR